MDLKYVAVDGQLAGAIELHATIRPEAKQIISELRQRGLGIYIISGDHEKPTTACVHPLREKLAHELGIEHYAASLPSLPKPCPKTLRFSAPHPLGGRVPLGESPTDRTTARRRKGGLFRRRWHQRLDCTYCASRQTANVSVSLRGASTIATDTAQIILMDGSLNSLVQVFDIATEMPENMKGNLFATIMPSVVTIGGAFFLHFGVFPQGDASPKGMRSAKAQ